MQERRKINQEKIYDEDGKLKYTIIPNYRKTDFFMSKNEIKFYKFLISIIVEINKEYNKKLEIFPQVALNRIIQQNNQRENDLEKDIFAKSIDFVLYDKNIDNIFCCIELDGLEHKTNYERVKRDKIIDKIFESVKIKLIRQDVQENYNKEILKEELIHCM